ncbi:MAG: secondary thiamine-phosphate synthase enzyme YjbQ [Anaerolineales bacterium]
MVHTAYIECDTSGNADMHDLTNQVQGRITEFGLEEGVVTIFTPSSTSALTTIEFESGALEDLRRALDTIAPPQAEYRHNLRWRDGNGHSHLRAAIMGPSLSIPVVNGTLILGTWQQILFIDFDNRSRHRKLIVQMVGDGV